MQSEQSVALTDSQVDIILTDLMDIYGYDFTNYSRASLKRRILLLMSNDRFPSFAEFRFRLRTDGDYFNRFVEKITVNVTEMFRDISFYKTLRHDILPLLAARPLIRIWHAGCSTGEEVYSMAILLHEANLLNKSLLYATDINPAVLDKVRAGIFPISQMKQYSENYILSGGKKDFSSYYTAQYNAVRFEEYLGKKIVMATHNLVSDGSFNEFQLILCRNVLIYFDKPLQDRSLRLFYNSLEMLGYLALGSKESLKFTEIQQHFKQHESGEKIWRKVS
ncbi:MAG TPA: protein-glutamate O-methyltransferase CheR [Chryseolinea sp.]